MINNKSGAEIHYILIGLLAFNIAGVSRTIDKCLCERHDALTDDTETPYRENEHESSVDHNGDYHAEYNCSRSNKYGESKEHNTLSSCCCLSLATVSCENDNDIGRQQIILQKAASDTSQFTKNEFQFVQDDANVGQRLLSTVTTSESSKIFLKTSILLI